MKVPECFGEYAVFLIDEESGNAETCIKCMYSDHCHKVTSCHYLNSLHLDIGLIVENLFDQGILKEVEDIYKEEAEE